MRARSRNRMQRVALVAALSAVQVVCGGLTAPDRAGERARPYDYALRTRQVVHWPVGSSIRVWADPGDGPRAGMLADALAGAARGWNRAATRGEYRIAPVGRVAQADVVVTWSDAAWPVDAARCPARADGSAVTAFCASRREPGRLTAFPAVADARSPRGGVRMLVVVRATLAADPSHTERVLAHELGHVLGIGAHSSDPADLMWGGRLRTAAPSPADRATVRALYRARADLRPRG